MARPAGVEPAALPSGGVRSIQLSYGRTKEYRLIFGADNTLKASTRLDTHYCLLTKSTKFNCLNIFHPWLVWKVK